MSYHQPHPPREGSAGKSGGGKGKHGRDSSRHDMTEADREREAHEKEQQREAYFDGLPDDEFTGAEEVMRARILDALSEAGLRSVRFSLIGQQEPVKQAKAALNLPKNVTLGQWMERRMGGEITIANDNKGELSVALAGAEAEGAPAEDLEEDYFNSLPPRLTQAEDELRLQLVEALKREGGEAKLASILRPDSGLRGPNKDFQTARGRCNMPKGMPLIRWIKRRLAEEVRVNEDSSKGAGAFLELLRHQRRREPPALSSTNSLPLVVNPAKERSEAEDSEATNSFISSLPEDSFTQEEARMRSAVMTAWHKKDPSGQGEPVRVSQILSDPAVRSAKESLLPPRVPLHAWIDARIGGELRVFLGRDKQYMIEAAHAGQACDDDSAGPGDDLAGAGDEDLAVDEHEGIDDACLEHQEQEKREPKAEKEALMVAAFSISVPWSQEEKAVRDSLLAILTRESQNERGGRAKKLGEVLNLDPACGEAWRALKASCKRKTPPFEPMLVRWVELRMPEDVRISREPYIQLSRERLDRLGLPVNCRERAKEKSRPHPPSVAPPAKVPRTSVGGGWESRVSGRRDMY